MSKQLLQFFGFLFVLVAIILFCIVFGGYSSLHRAEGRIEITKGLVLSACQSRLDLLPQLLDYLQKNDQKEMIAKIKQSGKEADIALQYAASQKVFLDKATTLKLETSQAFLTKELAKVFLILDQSESKNNIELLKAIKQQFFSAQDKLSIEKLKYNTEVRYFNRRIRIFPGFLIARLFGFDKSKYFEFSQDSFLGAEKVFGEKA